MQDKLAIITEDDILALESGMTLHMSSIQV